MNEATAIAEIQQARSRYQLERFVVGQHDTPEMRFYQLCIELQDMTYKLAHASLTVRRGELEIARLRRTGDELDAADADIKDLELQQTRLAMLGAEREVDVLRAMFEAHPKFTRAEIEAAQPEYWQARLTRQAELQQFGGRHGIGWAHLDAMRQAGALTELTAPTPGELE